MTPCRLNRLFHPGSRRCCDVAIDHGFFNMGVVHESLSVATALALLAA